MLEKDIAHIDRLPQGFWQGVVTAAAAISVLLLLLP